MTHRDDLLRPDPARGPCVIRRASHVEPASGLPLEALCQLAARQWPHGMPANYSAELQHLWPNAWWAAMVDGPVLGPFETRAAALAAEDAWLQEHLPCLNLSTTSSSC